MIKLVNHKEELNMFEDPRFMGGKNDAETESQLFARVVKESKNEMRAKKSKRFDQ
jgi:hypothetical protein